MKNKNKLLQAAITLALGATAHSSHALNTDILSFDAGVVSCLFSGTPPACSYGTDVATGSYFAMDVNGNGTFEVTERVAISPGPAGGITLGVLQPASGSHTRCPDGTESPGPDMPWCFFGNTGMHQVTVNPVIDNGDGTLSFTGWGVTWNGIGNIPLGGDPANFAADTGLAIINCVNIPCQVGDVTNLDYTAHVPLGDPSGFGGVGYSLHLANIDKGPVASISLTVTDGATQECNSTGGNTVFIQTNLSIPADDTIDTISWTVDGTVVASGESLSQFLSLGTHLIEAQLTTLNGLTGRASTDVIISDTTVPEVFAAFIDEHTNVAVSTVKDKDKVTILAEAKDICDANPSVTPIIGAPVNNSDVIVANLDKGSVKLNVPSLTLSVSATDSSGNNASVEAVLLITE